MALLAEERFEVVAGNDLFIALKQGVDGLWTVLISLSMDGGEFVIFVPLREVGLGVGEVLLCAFLGVKLGWQVKLVHIGNCSIEKYKS
jgi:hypothetical protein